jgi:DNA (cytosine-5)-methyltransferase 1
MADSIRGARTLPGGAPARSPLIPQVWTVRGVGQDTLRGVTASVAALTGRRPLRPKVVDLFAGGGGLSLGFADAGAHVVTAVEENGWAAATHRTNHPATLVLNDRIGPRWDVLSKLEEHFGEADCDVLVGGPPCQGWSTLGHRANDDRRRAMNGCVRLFLRQVELLSPPAVLMENVRGLAVKDGGKHLVAAEERLRSAGYRAVTYDVRAADFGVPQLRHRVFLVGVRDDLGLDFVLRPTRSESRWLSVWDAIGDLPSIAAGERADNYASGPRTALQRRLRRGSRRLTLHEAPSHSPRILQILAALDREGSSRTDIEDALGLGSGFHNTYCRLRSGEPAPAVTSSAGRVSSGRNAHPFDDRALTPREAARLQTFPDTYRWVGPGRWSIYEQIGNAVPPALARAVAKQLLSLIAPSLGLTLDVAA